MNTPQPPPEPAARKPVLVVPTRSRRDIILAICIILGIAGFIFLAVRGFDAKPGNTLSGVVQGRESTGERETLLEGVPTRDDERRVKYRTTQGVSRTTVDTGYYLKVYVEDEKRTYKVAVEKALWDQKKDGDRLEFLRPVEEQR